LLKELGARVVKVEQPGVGDYYRAVFNGEGILGGGQVQVINQGKESLGLDLKAEEGREIFKKLVRKADVVIENFRPGVLKKLKLDYPVLKKINRGVILCSITGFGQKGEKSRLAGHDLNYLGLSGLLSRIRDGEGRPVIPDFQIIDLAAGMEAAMKIAAALHERDKTGRGCRIDCAMVRTGYSLSRLYALGSRRTEAGKSVVAGGLIRYAVYRTSDGRWITLAALEPKFWSRFCRVVGRPEWAKEEGFRFLGEEKREELKKIFVGRSAQEWIELGAREDLCLFPVEEIEDLPLKPKKKAPELGAQTTRILRSLGLSLNQIKTLKGKGVV
jgi:crotonobetainyl-CoA:carnitine CoA-transferase CaiB-like acyl-CoA transferase